MLKLCVCVCVCASHHVVDEVSERPHHGHAHERDAEQDDVQEADAQQVGQPHAPAVHHTCVRVHLAVRRAHVHRDYKKKNKDIYVYINTRDSQEGRENIYFSKC